jgi:hypothetical protein
VYVLDEELEVVPVGVAGELYVGGVGVARGYVRQAGLTAERFVPDPYALEPGARMYRTGDRVRWSARGELEFVGRTDQQVKVRGFRIELGEIESALRQEAGVSEAVVVMAPLQAERASAQSESLLVGCVVAEAGAALSLEGLRARLRERLPEYLVPGRLVQRATLPLTSSGKVDRRTLRSELASVPRVREYVAPQTPTEEVLAQIWAEVLKVEHVGVHENFFELGGHSMLLMRMAQEINTRMSRPITLVNLFRYPTVATLGKFLDSGVSEPALDRSELESRVAGRKANAKTRARRKQRMLRAP